MAISITGGTITWAANELKNQFVACGVNPTIATYMESFVKVFTGATSGHAGFDWLDRDARLIIALQNFIRPLIDVAKACWGVYGVRGTTPATVAEVKAYINKASPTTWLMDNNDRQSRNDLTNIATLIADTIHSYLGDAAASDFTGSGPMVLSGLYDGNYLSPTYGTVVVLTQAQYAIAIEVAMTQLVGAVRAFVTKVFDYPQYLSNNYPDIQYRDLGVDDSLGSSEL